MLEISDMISILGRLAGAAIPGMQVTDFKSTCQYLRDLRIKVFLEKYNDIYGTGKVAASFADDFDNKGIGYKAPIVSERHKTNNNYMNHPFYTFSEIKEKLKNNNADVILALNKENTEQIVPLMKYSGINYRTIE